MLSDFIKKMQRKETVTIRSISVGELKITLGDKTYTLTTGQTFTPTDLADHATVLRCTDIRYLISRGLVRMV